MTTDTGAASLAGLRRARLSSHGRSRGGSPRRLVRQVLRPTTESKAISLVGVVAARILSVVLLKHGPRRLSWFTVVIAAVGELINVAGYGAGW